MARKTYPVGACWRYVATNGDVGEVWLQRREVSFEMWMYRFEHSDGSGVTVDWATSRSLAVYLCKVCFAYYRDFAKRPNMRFVRVANHEDYND